LAIVSRLAQLLQTEVKVRSAPGRGSVFSLRVRRGEDGAIAAPVAATEVTAGSKVPMLPVLVIDDDPLVLAGNRALLEELGCEVTTVADGDAAQSALAAFGGRPALVLCDLWLSEGQNGIELLQRLSALTVAPNSCILISGDTRPETIDAASAAGYPLLHKPVSPAHLRAVVMHFAWKLAQDGRSGTKR
jgi:CheY-like chemotaxis protein